MAVFDLVKKKREECYNCGKPLHFGTDRCRWCGALQLHEIEESDIGQYSQKRPEKESTDKKGSLLIPVLITISSLVVLVAIILIFIVNMSTSCLILLGFGGLLIVLLFLTQNPRFGGKNDDYERKFKTREDFLRNAARR